MCESMHISMNIHVNMYSHIYDRLLGMKEFSRMAQKKRGHMPIYITRYVRTHTYIYTYINKKKDIHIYTYVHLYFRLLMMKEFSRMAWARRGVCVCVFVVV